jgi:hypothetical protein
MSYSSNYTNRATIFDAGDTMEGDHIESVYEELGPSPSNIFEGLGVPYNTGSWWNISQGFGTASAKTANLLFLAPMVLTRSITFDRISSYVTAAGSTDTVIRMGIYNSNSSGMPSTLVSGSEVTQDGEVVNSSTIAGQTISVALGRGRYYIGVVAQGTGTMPTTTTASFGTFAINSGSSTSFTTIMGTRSSFFGVTGVNSSLTSDLSSSTFTQELSSHACAVRMA